MKYMPLEKNGSGHTGYQQQIKEANIKQIFSLVRSGKCKSRAEIVRYMDLSATSVSMLVEELIARKLIDETGPTQTSLPGRRPINLKLNTDAHHLAVFSVSTAGVRYALLNMECRIIEDLFVPMDAHSLVAEGADREYIRLFDDILRNRSRLFSPSRAVMIGICFPGAYVENDHMFHTEYVLGFPLLEETIRQFQQRVGLPLFLLSSTRSMAYAEKKFLDAANPDAPGIQDLLFVKVQEGIRCAIISRGDLYPGPFNISGEIGHFTIDYRGKPCHCGSRGCLWNYANQDAILEDARQAAREAGIEEPRSFDELARRYPDEPALLGAVRKSAQLLAFGLYGLLCSSGMRHIALGGGITALGDPFLKEVYHAVMKRTLLIRQLDLSYAQAGPDAEILGIAQRFLDKVFTITM